MYLWLANEYFIQSYIRRETAGIMPRYYNMPKIQTACVTNKENKWFRNLKN